MSKERFSGVLAPVITPFNADLSPNGERFNAHCRWLTNQGAGLAVFGTNSEANSLSLQEKLGLLGGLLEAGMDPGRLMPGTGSCALTDAVELTRFAVTAGCRGALMLPPFYYKGVSDEGLFRYYAEVIERVAHNDLQIYLYHIPQATQVPLSIALIDRLVKAYPAAVAGIKDSSGDWDNTRALLDQQWPDFRVFCGSESFLLQNMQHGGAGCISATANVNPAAIHDLFVNWAADDAPARQASLDSIRQIFQSLPMISALKAATGLYSGEDLWMRVRPPLVALDGAQTATLKAALDAADFAMPGLA